MIYSVALNMHDHNTYDGKIHKQLERYSRYKRNLYTNCCQDFYETHFLNKMNSEVFAFTYTKGGINNLKENPFETSLKKYSEIKDFRPDNLWDYIYQDNIYYIDHHQSHAVYAYLSSGYEESDILAIDGGGIGYRCIFVDKDKKIHDLSKELPIGWLWNIGCIISGFHPLDAGKLMGLAGYGEYSEYFYNIFELHIDEIQHRKDKFYFANSELKAKIDSGEYRKEDVAYTLQQFTNNKIKEWVFPLKTCNNICIAGGVAYNGYMNELFTKYYENVFVPPAVGDEGQALGTYMHAEYVLNNRIHVPDLYAGEEYENVLNDIDYNEIAQAIADGKIVGWYQGRSESGNRALGNRSILADPRNPNIKDIINSRIKMREDFRPFAPSVLEEHYRDYFNTNQPSPYMSRIVPVISEEIPGVTHVDGTARIQTVNSNINQCYYNLIKAFYNITRIPMLLNTSFNCQEPIVETPSDALKTFRKTELDILIMNGNILYD